MNVLRRIGDRLRRVFAGSETRVVASIGFGAVIIGACIALAGTLLAGVITARATADEFVQEQRTAAFAAYVSALDSAQLAYDDTACLRMGNASPTCHNATLALAVPELNLRIANLMKAKGPVDLLNGDSGPLPQGAFMTEPQRGRYAGCTPFANLTTEQSAQRDSTVNAIDVYGAVLGDMEHARPVTQAERDSCNLVLLQARRAFVTGAYARLN